MSTDGLSTFPFRLGQSQCAVFLRRLGVPDCVRLLTGGFHRHAGGLKPVTLACWLCPWPSSWPCCTAPATWATPSAPPHQQATHFLPPAPQSRRQSFIRRQKALLCPQQVRLLVLWQDSHTCEKERKRKRAQQKVGVCEGGRNFGTGVFRLQWLRGYSSCPAFQP